MQERSGRRLEGALADARPGLAQVGDVVGELGVARLGAVGAQDEAAADRLAAFGSARGDAACTSAAMRARSCSRSSGEPIFCEMPTWSSCGRNTSSRPAIVICVDRRAPLVPIGSLITCTVSVWPSKTCCSIGTAAALRAASGGSPSVCR